MKMGQRLRKELLRVEGRVLVPPEMFGRINHLMWQGQKRSRRKGKERKEIVQKGNWYRMKCMICISFDVGGSLKVKGYSKGSDFSS